MDFLRSVCSMLLVNNANQCNIYLQWLHYVCAGIYIDIYIYTYSPLPLPLHFIADDHNINDLNVCI